MLLASPSCAIENLPGSKVSLSSAASAGYLGQQKWSQALGDHAQPRSRSVASAHTAFLARHAYFASCDAGSARHGWSRAAQERWRAAEWAVRCSPYIWPTARCAGGRVQGGRRSALSAVQRLLSGLYRHGSAVAWCRLPNACHHSPNLPGTPEQGTVGMWDLEAGACHGQCVNATVCSVGNAATALPDPGIMQWHGLIAQAVPREPPTTRPGGATLDPGMRAAAVRAAHSASPRPEDKHDCVRHELDSFGCAAAAAAAARRTFCLRLCPS
jgi:hypothetical protein